MCHVCVMENVKAKVSRRSLFKGAAIAAASGLMANVGLTSALAADKPRSFSRVVDLTHTLTKDFPTFFGTPAFEEEFQFKYDKDKLNLKVLKYAEHIGTHLTRRSISAPTGPRSTRCRSKSWSARWR